MEEIDFGFFFCRVMHFFSMSYEAVLRLPLRTFWLLNRNIDRIEARRDMRAMSVAMVAQSDGETANTFRQELVIEAGVIVKLEGEGDPANPLEAKRDEMGFADLKRMAGQTIGQ